MGKSMDELTINLESGVPIYMQLVDRIKQMVVSGQLLPGQQLPTIRQLAIDLRVNYNTVGRAYLILDQEGVISTQQGRGTFVASRLDEGQVQKLRMGKLRSMFGQAIREAHALGYSREEIERIVEEQLTNSPFGADEADREPQ